MARAMWAHFDLIGGILDTLPMALSGWCEGV